MPQEGWKTLTVSDTVHEALREEFEKNKIST